MTKQLIHSHGIHRNVDRCSENMDGKFDDKIRKGSPGNAQSMMYGLVESDDFSIIKRDITKTARDSAVLLLKVTLVY